MSDLPAGIYRTPRGYRAIVAIAAGRKEKRFPRGTAIKEMTRWRNAMRVKLETRFPLKAAGATPKGSFAADVERYLGTLTITSWASRRSELRAWMTQLGRLRRRGTITEEHVRGALKTWTEANVPPKTIINRMKALAALYHTLDGPKAWTPCDDVVKPKVPKRSPRDVPVETLRAVELALRAGDPKTHARYMVLVATGARPSHLKRAQPQDIDLERGVWYIHGAKDGNAVPLPLNDDMRAAWSTFIAAEAWGPFNATDYAKALRAAGWPASVRPYTAKHAFGIALGEAGVDMQVIADWFGHTKVETTRIYVPALLSRLKDASARVNGRLGWGVPEPSPNHPVALDLGALTVNDRKALLQQLLTDVSLQQ